MIPALINYGVIKFIFNTSRVESTLTLMEKLKSIWSGVKSCFLYTSDVYPKYVFLIVIAVVTIILLVKIIKSEKNKKQKAVYIFGWFYIVGATVVSTAAPQIMQDSVYMVPRNTYAIGALFGILLVYLFSNFEISDIIKNVIIVVSIVLLGIQLINFNDILVEHYQTNFFDSKIADEIRDKVLEYEEETGNSIQYMVLYEDSDKSINYDGIRYYGDVNVKAFGNSWGARGILDLKLERELVDETSNEEKYNKYSEYFENKNWDYFDIDEQLILDEDTLYLCVY